MIWWTIHTVSSLSIFFNYHHKQIRERWDINLLAGFVLKPKLKFSVTRLWDSHGTTKAIYCKLSLFTSWINSDFLRQSPSSRKWWLPLTPVSEPQTIQSKTFPISFTLNHGPSEASDCSLLLRRAASTETQINNSNEREDGNPLTHPQVIRLRGSESTQAFTRALQQATRLLSLY